MHRFYLPPEQTKGATVTLSESDAHHAAQVLRLRKGDAVVVLDGEGSELHCETADVSRKHVQLLVKEKTFVAAPPFEITLLQAVPKGKLIEFIIQKATELGVARIVPLLTDRVITRLDAAEAADKKEKWQQVAIEAIKQCGQTWLPEVLTPMTPKDFLARGEKFELPLVGSLQADSQHPRTFFRKFQEERNRLPQSLAIWVGPEGDFTPQEMEMIKAAGVSPITLGRLVLRCDTAALYCLSVLNYELNS